MEKESLLIKPKNKCDKCDLFYEEGKPHLADSHCLAEAKKAFDDAMEQLGDREAELALAAQQIQAEQRVLYVLAKGRGGILKIAKDAYRAVPNGASIKSYVGKNGTLHIECIPPKAKEGLH